MVEQAARQPENTLLGKLRAVIGATEAVLANWATEAKTNKKCERQPYNLAKSGSLYAPTSYHMRPAAHENEIVWLALLPGVD